MGSVGAGLASVGGSIAGAQELQRKQRLEEIKQAIEQGRLGVEQQYAQTNQQRLGLDQQRQDLEARREQQLEQLRDAQIKEIMKRVNASPALVQKRKDAETALGRPLKDDEALAILGIRPPAIHQTEYEKTRDRLKAEGEMLKENPALMKLLHPGRASATGGGTVSDAEEAAQNIHEGSARLLDYPTKMRPAIATAMRKHGWKGGVGPLRPLNTQEQRLVDSIDTIEPMLDNLDQAIKQGGLEKDNSPIAPRSAWLAYKYLKIAPSDPIRGELIRDSAALQVMGAAPWIQIGRGKYLFDTISNHLPNPEDSPKLLLDKIKFLRKMMSETKASLGVTGENDMQPGGGAPATALPGGDNNNPLGLTIK